MNGIALCIRLLLLMLLLLPLRSRGDDFSFHAPATADDRNTPDVMRDLAERVLPVYQDADIERYLGNLSMLQLVAGNYKAAYDSRQSLRERRHDEDAGRPVGRALLIDLYTHAKAIEAGQAKPFAAAFTQSYREEVPALGDLDAYAVTSWLGASPDSCRAAVQSALDRVRSKDSLSLDASIELLRTWMLYDAYRSFAPVVGNLIADENTRRYQVSDNLLIHTRQGLDLHARWVRPKTIGKPLPTLLEFTILSNLIDDPRACAAHGYVCVVAWTRGRNGGLDMPKDRNDPVVPFEHDGEDAKAVIDWIAHQPWSDGRVGMVGDGYSGFAAWAATHQHPAALKAIATSDAIAPGVSFPASGQIFRSASYRWAIENTEPPPRRAMDDAAWNALDLAWYRSGKPYRDLDHLSGLSSRIFRRWLNHPSYDRYWQKMVPAGTQFGKVDIPVLSISGYYANGSVGSLFYFDQLARYAKNPNQTLLLGPWDDAAIRSAPSAQLLGYSLDPAALVDLRDLRFQWLDHVFKGSPLPLNLGDHVNYEVMGANEWRHVPSLAAMSNSTLRFYLDGSVTAGLRHLAPIKAAHAKASLLTIRLADRSDDTLPVGSGILGKSLASRDRLIYVGDPVKSATELAGSLSGQLDFKINKMDMDLDIGLYEQLPDGQYLQLAIPCGFRASYARDRIHRHLLKAGERQQLDFHCEPIVSRRIEAGSRLALVVGIDKRPDREINYGGGDDVSAESLDDDREPLKLQWFASSYIELPVKK